MGESCWKEGLLSVEECGVLIGWAESMGFEEALLGGAGGLRVPGLRDNDRVVVDDEERANYLWGRLCGLKFIEEFKIEGYRAIGLNERLRVYRYAAGQSFGWHRDGRFRKGDGSVTRVTVLVYLNDDYRGGETELESGTVEVKAGAVLGFIHELRHRGRPVEEGVKYVLRTDILYQLCD